jgi:hypothetical protein
MAAPAPNADPAAIAALPALALALCQDDASAFEVAAVQLRDFVTKNSDDDAQAAVCVAVARSCEVVDAAFVQALRRPLLSDTAQRALLTTMMTMLNHDDVMEVSTAMMQACPLYLPILLRIIAQEQPVSVCRYSVPPQISHIVLPQILFEIALQF